MTAEELQETLTNLRQADADRQAQLASDLQAAEEAAIINAAPLENQLNALVEQQQAGRSALLANQFNIAENVLSTGSGFGGLATTLDAIDGTNISKAAEALANQERLLIRGGGAAGDIQRQQLGFNQEDQQALQADLREQQTKELQSQAKLQTELNKAQKSERDLQLQEINFANDLRKEKRKEDREDEKEAVRKEERRQDFNLRKINAARRSSSGSGGGGARTPQQQVKDETAKLKLQNLKDKQVEVPKKVREQVDERSRLIGQLQNLDKTFASEDADLAFSGAGFLIGELGESENTFAKIASRGLQALPDALGGATARARASVGSDIRFVTQQVATIIEKGKLSDRDLPRYAKLLPDPKDSIAVARKKYKQLLDTVIQDQEKEIRREQRRGKDVSIFEGQAGAPSGLTSQGQSDAAASADSPAEDDRKAQLRARIKQLRGG